MALIQVKVSDEIKEKADTAFARNGLSTPAAMKIMITQVANLDRTPLDNTFVGEPIEYISEQMKLDMLRAEAQEYGLIEDDAEVWSGNISDNALSILGLTRNEVTRD